jgi:hypothetical protein
MLALREGNVTVIVGVPRLYEALLAAIDAHLAISAMIAKSSALSSAGRR